MSAIMDRIHVERLSALYLWAIFIVIFGVLKPSSYLTSATVSVILAQGVVVAIIALGVLIPLAANLFDLSVGGTMALSTLSLDWLSLHTGWPVFVDVLIALATGLVVGALNGFIVLELRVNSFIGTLAMSELLMGVALYLSGQQQIVGSFPAEFSKLGIGAFGSVPYLFIVLILIAVALWYVLEYTPLGRFLFAVGGNVEAARLAGLRTTAILRGSLLGSAFFAALAGVFYSMNVGTFDTSVGPGYLFPAFAAVFFGASQFSRRPNVWGTLIAYFALAFGIYGLEVVGGPETVWTGPLFQGVTLVLAVSLAARQGMVGPLRRHTQRNTGGR